MWGWFKSWRRETTHEVSIPDALNWIIRRIDRIEDKSNRILHNQEKIMATVDDLVAAAQAEDTKIDSLIALVIALKAKVDAIPGLTPEQQAAIDAAFASISDNPDRIQAAIDANTPPT